MIISKQSRGKPQVVVHFDIERRFEQMDERGVMRVIEVTESRCIDRCTSEEVKHVEVEKGLE